MLVDDTNAARKRKINTSPVENLWGGVRRADEIKTLFYRFVLEEYRAGNFTRDDTVVVLNAAGLIWVDAP